MADWYYVEAGQPKGPIDDEQVRKLAVEGVLTPATPVCEVGASTWGSVADVEGRLGLARNALGTYTPQASPPPPPAPFQPEQYAPASPPPAADAGPAQWAAPAPSDSPASGISIADKSRETMIGRESAGLVEMAGGAAAGPTETAGGIADTASGALGGTAEAAPWNKPEQPQPADSWGQPAPAQQPAGSWGQPDPIGQPGSWDQPSPAGPAPASWGVPGAQPQPYGAQPQPYGAQPQPYGAQPQPYAVPMDYASWIKRVAAFIIDWVIVSIPGIIVGAVTGSTTTTTTDSGFAFEADPISTLVFIVVGIAYFGFLNGRGQTLGKMALGTKVVDAQSGAAIGIGRAVVRYVISFVAWLTCIGGLLDALWPLWDARNQTLHDKVGKSVVVNSR